VFAAAAAELLKLFGNGCANRANACASAALETLLSVDYVLAVFFSDALNGALGSASAAAEAFVSNDFVSHDMYLRYKIDTIVS
jgi:hypothetical protein